MNTNEKLDLIRSYATTLRLSTIRTNLLELTQHAESKGMTYMEFLQYIFHEELSSRREKRLVNGLKPAGLTKSVDLDSLELPEGYGIDDRRLRILRELLWAKNEAPYNLIMIGDNGLGKTTICKGLLTEAIGAAMRPYYGTFEDILHVLKNKETDPRCKKTYDYIVNKIDILCVDGVRKCAMAPEVAVDFDVMVDKLHSKASIIITSTRPVSEWKDIFYNDSVTKSILERLVQRSETITLKGTSFRLTHHEGFFNRLDENKPD